jgi:fumarate reductase flavoprotein subunit
MKKIMYRLQVLVYSVLCIAFLSCSNDDTTTVNYDESCDMVVIGGGGAGLSAAYKAAESKCKVILLEKTDKVGGNTVNATGGLNACNTPMQKALGINDSEELFFHDTMKGGHYLNDTSLVWTLVKESKNTVTWLTNIGMDLSDVGFMAGSSVARTHRPTGGNYVGPYLVNALNTSAQNSGVDIRVNSKVTDVIEKEGAAVGIKVENNGRTYNISTKAVIICTGGFSANHEMVVKYGGSRLANFGTTNKPCATGDAFAWVEKFDAALTQMDQIQTHPTVLASGFMITEAVRGNGAILVNKEGKRFCNEMDTRDIVSDAVVAQTDGKAYVIFDQAVFNSLAAISYYYSRGFLTKADSYAALADSLGLASTDFVSTMQRYSTMQKNGTDEDFGREGSQMLQPLTQAPFYGVKVSPAIHYTMGGLKIDTKGHVLTSGGKIIQGLYAAGEVTGGVHGGNRLGGNSMTDITTFGRIAAGTAIEELK